MVRVINSTKDVTSKKYKVVRCHCGLLLEYKKEDIRRIWFDKIVDCPNCNYGNWVRG